MSHVLQASGLQAMVTSSITKISNDDPEGVQELEDVLLQWGGSFGYIQVSAAFVKAAKLRRLRPADAKPLLDKLAGMWDTQLPDAEPRQLANVLWACGKLRIYQPTAVEQHLDRVSGAAAAGNPGCQQCGHCKCTAWSGQCSCSSTA